MRLGFIGGWGHSYLRGLLSDPAVDIEHPVAVASDGHDAAAAKRLAESFGVPTIFFDSPDTLLDQYKPDVVNVGSYYGYNGDLVAKVIARAISCVSDKPIAATWKQLDHLRELVQASGARIITEFNFRSEAPVRSAREAVQAGLIGEVALATGQKSYRFGNQRPAWYGDRAAYGSTLLWVAGHAIDAIPFITGLSYTRVTGRHANITKPQLARFEDHVVNLFEMSNGASAAVHADFLRPASAPSHADDRLRIVGSNGQVEIRDGRCKLITHEQPEVDITDRVTPQSTARELLAAVTGEDRSIYTTEESLKMAAVLLHARDAADKQKWIDL